VAEGDRVAEGERVDEDERRRAGVTAAAHAGTGVAEALDRVVRALPGGGELRAGQRRMADAVNRAVDERRHLIVQAGTGTGKSLAYLLPAILAGARVVVSTATKALQEQLANKDLPFLASHLGVPVTFAVLKGRSNYLCRQRALEVAGGGDQLDLSLSGEPPGDDGPTLGAFGREVRRLLEWAVTTETGDRAELPFEPSSRAWATVSVSAVECPGAARCPSGDVCFAEAARQRAGEADVVVVNTHLYATHLAADSNVLPPHDVVIFDEAHELEDVASASLGLEIGPGRFQGLARSARALVPEASIVEGVADAATRLVTAIEPHIGRRLEAPVDDALGGALILARDRVSRLSAAVRNSGGDAARKARAQQALTHLLNDLDQVLALADTHVAWVEGPAHQPVLRVAPVDVGPLLHRLLWNQADGPTGVLTSATIPPGLSLRIGLGPDSWDEIDVGSPFDFAHQALLYCAAHLPDPRTPGYEPAMHDELEGLINAAGGRTLALFTSWRAMGAARDALAPRLPFPLLSQADLPKPALIKAFREDEHACLFATLGFWQGVDVPGRALSLVTIDRIPFPRPDDPLLQARRDRLGPRAFGLLDLPRAATLLAQGAGRLIRSSSDRGVVAVLDPRLATKGYRWDLVRALPPMLRTRKRADVEAFLMPLREEPATR
jgi:ATP-dependent DNA helicase DinG